ncbi:hypothetical protein Tco_0333496 [Tanacetum coccineum]
MVSKHPLWSANSLQNTPYGLHIIYSVRKFLSMVESLKATVKDSTKLLVTDEIVDYILEKYGNNWNCEDKIADVILEDLWMKYEKYDKGKGKEIEHHQLKVNKYDKGKGKVHEAKKAKQADHDQGMHFVVLRDKMKVEEGKE